jgi:hypothetical protein
MLHQVFTITTFQITGENPMRAVWDQQQESPLNLRGGWKFSRDQLHFAARQCRRFAKVHYS